MRIAADGKPFDIDNIIGNAASDEAEVIQFLRPSATRRRMLAKVGEELARYAERLVLSCEDLQNGAVVIYVRKKREGIRTERTYIAHNGPGQKSPTEVLKRAIKHEMRNDESD